MGIENNLSSNEYLSQPGDKGQRHLVKVLRKLDIEIEH